MTKEIKLQDLTDEEIENAETFSSPFDPISPAFESLRAITGAGRCDCHFTGCEHDRARNAIVAIEKELKEGRNRESGLRGKWGTACEALGIYNKVQSRLPTTEEAVAKIEKLISQRDEARRAKITQYHTVPLEDSAECQTWPWHSPLCYSQHSARNEDDCICGLTKLRKENRDLLAEVQRLKNPICNCGRTKIVQETCSICDNDE